MIQNNQIASAYSPPFRIVAKYFIAAIISFVIFNLLLTLNYEDISGHHFQPKILSVTHIATLGFITMIIFGAMFSTRAGCARGKIIQYNSCRSSILDFFSWDHFTCL